MKSTRQKRIGIAVGAAIVVALVVGIVVAQVTGQRDVATEQPIPRVPVASQWQDVCGFPDELVSKIVADAPADDSVPLGRIVEEIEDVTVLDLLTNGSDIVLQVEGDAPASFVRYSVEGGEPSFIEVEFDRDEQPVHGGGRAALADDGSLFVLDTYQGRRDVAQVDREGRTVATFPVPTSAVTTGHPHDLFDVDWIDDYRGDPALVVYEGWTIGHVFRPDGTPLDTIDLGVDATLGSVGDGAVATFRDEADDRGPVGVNVTHLETGTMLAQLAGDVRARDLTRGPDGDGFLVYQPETGIRWYDSVGVQRGTWLREQRGEILPTGGALAEHDGVYWVLVDGPDDETGIARLSGEEMRYRLEQSVTGDVVSSLSLFGLGAGADVVTDQEYNHFDAGHTPSVVARFEQGWGQLGDESPGDRYELVYTVTGDPLLAEVVRQDPMTAPVPIGGGEVPLSLPDPRPGAYEVEAALRDVETDELVSSTCLHYSVGAEGAELELDGLADGAGWGGADPLRGVQIADRLGVGSHRYQLDFDAVVPDATAPPTSAGLDWSVLPGSPARDDATFSVEAAFAELREASELALQTDVTLIIQVGQGGGGELTAVEEGTWEGWAALIVEEFAAQTDVRHWQPWNEPNLFLPSGAEYATQASIPFARAAHRVDPEALVIGGNTLGFALEWWEDSVRAGICDEIDIIGVHPYTGWNRSWEEEGFADEGNGYDMFREALGSECQSLPIWDTETGWSSDGPANFWALGANAARKLLWYQHEGIEEWTYFYSEGGWGESNLSVSLMQVWEYVKPGGLAFSTVSRLLEGRAPGALVDTGVPFTYAMQFEGPDTLTAVWSDDMRIEVALVTDASTLTVIDHYGARRELAVEDGSALMTVTGAPQFLVTPGGESVRVEAPRPFGEDVLAGRPVTVSSTNEEADAQVVTSGTVNVYRPWRTGRLPNGEIDEAPFVQVDLAEPTRLDRIAVASGSILCCETGLRDYTVSVLTPDGEWDVVAEQKGQFFERVVMFEFEPREAVAVRVDVPWTEVRGVPVLAVNYSGLAGGLPPPFMGLQTESDLVVSVSAVSAWAAE